jgi:Alpha-L-fucosidase C-terminal domain
VIIALLATGKVESKIEKVSLLGHADALEFVQDESGLRVTMPAEKSCNYAFTLEITGIKM